MAEFQEFKKIPRFYRPVVVTEKLDGTNACVVIDEDDTVSAQSRSRVITPENDNYGFAKWVAVHAEELRALGPGYHFGEWWGNGIQRNYGLAEKRFSLFNVGRWQGAQNPPDEELITPPACCHVVPILARSPTDITWALQAGLEFLRTKGSAAAPGFAKPEGVIAYHRAAGQYFKATFERDEEGKQNG